MRNVIRNSLLGGAILSFITLSGAYAWPEKPIFDGTMPPTPDQTVEAINEDDINTPERQIAVLVTRLVKQTRKAVGGRLTFNKPTHLVNDENWLAVAIQKGVLPAAIVGAAFFDTVEMATLGNAGVKMVTLAPRNPHNEGDEVELAMLNEYRALKARGDEVPPYMVWETKDGVVYAAEPIVASELAMANHGPEKGEEDPNFSEYHKEGWEVGEIVGVVVTRVEPLAHLD